MSEPNSDMLMNGASPPELNERTRILSSIRKKNGSYYCNVTDKYLLNRVVTPIWGNTREEVEEKIKNLP